MIYYIILAIIMFGTLYGVYKKAKSHSILLSKIIFVHLARFHLHNVAVSDCIPMAVRNCSFILVFGTNCFKALDVRLEAKHSLLYIKRITLNDCADTY